MDYTALSPSVIDHLEADSKAKAIEALTAPSTRSPIEATRVAKAASKWRLEHRGRAAVAVAVREVVAILF
jgi:hypothetical protein